ncbi:MAG: FAD-binding oxidoreductase [Lutibacter sp.]
MYLISLKNNKTFECSENDTLIEGARKAGITLEHSCLSGRCSSCKVMVDDGLSEPTMDEVALSQKEKEDGFILSCVRTPKTDMVIRAEDLSEYKLAVPKTLPAKINNIEKLTEDVLKVTLRFPPNQPLNFMAGQYVNVIKGNIKRSYSIGNSSNKNTGIELFIKKYPGGLLSQYWFNEAKINDLLRIEGPRGTFFLRNNASHKNIIFLATGTGIAPVKSILESIAGLSEGFKNKNVYVFWGVKYGKDLFWTPENLNFNIKYFPVLSREKTPSAEAGHIQDVLLSKNIDLKESIVYACGSNDMIHEAKNKLIENGLADFNFYSDAFVTSN